MLYPQQNEVRNLLDLSGVWDFQTDPEARGETYSWYNGLPAARPLPLPGSWKGQDNDRYADLGPAWYFRKFSVPAGWQGQRVMVGIDFENHAARAWLNGREVGEHAFEHAGENPLLVAEVTAGLDWTGENALAIRVDKELNAVREPADDMDSDLLGGPEGGYPGGAFDFHPSAGLRRPVLLFSTPQTCIEAVSVVAALEGTRGVMKFSVAQNGTGGRGRVRLEGNGASPEAALVFVGNKARAVVAVQNVRQWTPEDPFQYEATLTLFGAEGGPVDCYRLPVGIRMQRAAPDAPPKEEDEFRPTSILQALEKVAKRLDGKHPGMNRVLGFQLEGEGWFRLVIEDGRCRAEAGEGPTDAAVRMKSEDASRLLSGKLNPVMAVMSGKVKISGDMKALAILQSLK